MTPVVHVVLVEPEIHWNTGNAGRSCLGAGAKLHIVEPIGFSLEAKQVRRAGLDYWPRVEPRLWPNWEAFEKRMPELGEAFFVSPGASKTLWEATFPERVVLIFGKETEGFAPAVREKYRERLISIPMRDPALRSLNLSTCVGIAVYEVLRQWA